MSYVNGFCFDINLKLKENNNNVYNHIGVYKHSDLLKLNLNDMYECEYTARIKNGAQMKFLFSETSNECLSKNITYFESTAGQYMGVWQKPIHTKYNCLEILTTQHKQRVLLEIVCYYISEIDIEDSL
jgi:hypothetical protein